MPSLIISSASRSSPRIFIYHSSHIILIPSSFHSIILAFFTFPLIHSPWCSSRFPQNSFSTISFIIPSYSLFHPLFYLISLPSPASPLISAFHSHSHLCSLFIHLHPFSSHSSSQPLQSYSLLSIFIPIISFHSIPSFPFISNSSFDSSFSRVQWYPHPSVSIAHFYLIHYSSHSSIFHPTHPIHIVSSLPIIVPQL